jgi:transposase
MELARETDLTILRAKAVIIERENGLLHRRLAELSAELDKLRGTDADTLQVELDLLSKQLATERKALYGRSSERRGRPASASEQPESSEQPQGDKTETAPQTGHGPTPQPTLPVVEQHYELTDEQRSCSACGGELQQWDGQFEDSEQVDVVQRSFRIVRHRRQKYRCKCGGCVRTAPGPDKLTPQGRYTLAFVAHVATAKYLDHLPLYRQTQQMARQGLAVTTSSLCDQLEQLALLLRPSCQALHAEVIAEPVVGVDETPWPVLDKANQRWWAWSVASRGAVYYRIAKTRSHRDADKILEGFSGVAVCDAYSAYPALRSARGAKGEQLALATCWAHARRRFVKAEQHQPQAAAALEIIGRLYAVEAKAREFAEPGSQPWYDKLAELRATESVAALSDLDAWRASISVMPRSALGKAVNYLDNQRRGLRMFLRNPQIPLDNNDAERAIRGLALGRKNHYGSKSRDGTETAAILYSLLETAKRVGVDPEGYLCAAVLAAKRPCPRTLTPSQYAAELTELAATAARSPPS